MGQTQPSKGGSLTYSLQLRGSSSLPVKAAQHVLIWTFHFQLEREAEAISTLCSVIYTSGSQTSPAQRRLPYLPVASIQTGILDGLHACICPVQAL